MKPEGITFRHEVWRKLIHLSSLWIPLLYGFISRDAMSILLAVLTALAFAIEFGRRRFDWLQRPVHFLFGRILREHESRGLTGTTYVLLGSLITVFLFAKPVALVSLAVLVVSDTAAALIGRRYGRRPLLDKSMEGSLAFFISGAICVFIIAALLRPHLVFIVAGLVGTLAGTVAELYAKRWKVDDNILIPLAVGFAMTFILLSA